MCTPRPVGVALIAASLFCWTSKRVFCIVLHHVLVREQALGQLYCQIVFVVLKFVQGCKF